MNNRPENFDGARGILGQRVSDARPARKLRGAISEHFRSSVGPGQRDEYVFQRLRLQNTRSLFANRGVWISGKNTERLDAVFRPERSRLVADG